MSVSQEREQTLIQKLKARFPAEITDARIVRRSRPEIVVRAEKLVEVATFLRDELGMDHANGVSGVDYNREARFEIVYHCSSIQNKEMRDIVMAVKESVPRNSPKARSLISVWPGVDNFERETFEMFGITFDGHPRMEKLFLTDNWDGPPPLRKEVRFPTD
jgi:NADH-quinone oxidoreductase subunit C